jgi:hypothetical protein
VDDIISHILVQLTITSPTHAREMQILHQISRAMPSLSFSQCATNSVRKPLFAAENDNRADATDLICRSPDQPAFEAGIFHVRSAKQRGCIKCNHWLPAITKLFGGTMPRMWRKFFDFPTERWSRLTLTER